MSIEEAKTTSYDVSQLDNLPDDIREFGGKHFTLMLLVDDPETGKTNKLPIDAYDEDGKALAWRAPAYI